MNTLHSLMFEYKKILEFFDGLLESQPAPLRLGGNF